MTDGDKFERKLGNKEWRRAYRYACGNEPLPDITLLNQLIKATSDYLHTNIPRWTIEKTVLAVFKALNNVKQCQRQFEFSPIDPLEPHNTLCRKLEVIAGSEVSSTPIKLVVQAAKSVFNQHKSNNEFHTIDMVNIDKLNNQFAEQISFMIIDEKLFGRSREGIMEKTGRTPIQQIEWEKNLSQLDETKDQIQKLFKKYLGNDAAVPLRAPRRLKGLKRETTIEMLHQPLKILE